MKILKFLKNILKDISSIILFLIILLVVTAVVGTIGTGGLFIILYTSCRFSTLFNNSIIILAISLVIWTFGLECLFSWKNPIKEIKGDIVNIKNYFKKKWNEVE